MAVHKRAITEVDAFCGLSEVRVCSGATFTTILTFI